MIRTLTRGAGIGLAMIGIFSCSEHSVTGSDNLNTDDLTADAARLATVGVSFGSSSIAVGDTTRATATLRDYQGRQLYNRIVTWSSSDSTIARVSTTGLVTGVGQGTATITASRAGKSGSGTIEVTAPITGTGAPTPVSSVSVSLAASTLNPGQTTQATAITYDSSNNVLTGRTVSWSSSNTAVATVSSSGLVSAVAAGSSQITAASEGKSGSAAATVASPQTTTNPGTVTDLKVLSTDSTGVTLSFTQVNDGNGQAARYDVRYAAPPIAWGSATSATSGTCAVPLAGTAIGSSLVCKVLGLTPSTRYDFQVIAFRGTLNFDAVFGSLSNVATGTTTAAATPPPPPPPPPPGSYNEPAGMTLISQRPFNSLNENPSWDTDNTLSIEQDATAPFSPTSVLRATFPAGFVAGESNGHAGIQWGPGYRTLYIRYWTKYSPNWQGQQTFSKQLYAWVNGSYPPIFFGALGSGSAPLTPEPVLQRMIVGDGFKSPNLVPGAVFTRGQWDLVEIVLVGNSAGTADGTLDWYLNGVHIGSYSGLQYATGAARWDIFEFYPVWGGVGGPNVASTMWIQWDHVYLSGKD